MHAYINMHAYMHNADLHIRSVYPCFCWFSERLGWLGLGQAGGDISKSAWW